MINQKIKKFIINNLIKPPSSAENADGGFSLMELTAVVVILSILGSLTLPNITKWIK